MQATNDGAMAPMPAYYGTKKIWALRLADVVGGALIPDDPNFAPIVVTPEWVAKHKPEPGGYYVTYPDGYKSYSPAAPFEEAYQRNGALSFGHALFALQAGHRLARDGWNGKNMFIFLVGGSEFKVNRAPLTQFYDVGTPVTYRPHIDMKAVDGSIGVWVASHSDMLARDWRIVG